MSCSHGTLIFTSAPWWNQGVESCSSYQEKLNKTQAAASSLLQSSGTSEFGLGCTQEGRFLLIFVLAEPFSASPVCSAACTPEVQHLGRGFHRWRLELKPWPRSKGKHDSGGLDSIPRGASSTSSAHAQGGTHSPNTPRCLRIWRSGLGRVSDCSLRLLPAALEQQIRME